LTVVMLRLPPMPSPRELVRLYRLSAVKELSQNFIMDLNITDKLARTAAPLEGATVIEVGPGPGSLTRSLLTSGARKVIAVEKDKRFLPALETLQQAANGRLELVFEDMLRVDERELLKNEPKARDWADESPIRIVGNLPFSVATELLLKWIRQIPERQGPFAHGRTMMSLMFQLEVGKRIEARPGTADYGRLSVMTQQSCVASVCFTLPPTVFVPPPKVSAVMVKIQPRCEPLAPAPIKELELVCRQVFGQRRKVLSNAITTLGEGSRELIKRANLDPMKRPDALTIEEWCTLARAYKEWMEEMKASSGFSI